MTVSTFAPATDWLRLWCLVHQSHRSTALLLQEFSSPTDALTASPSDWRRLGIAPGQAQRLAHWQQENDPALLREMQEGVLAKLHWCEQPGHTLLAQDHEDYPALLREIPDPPPLLFLRGNSMLLGLPQLAIVGSRKPSLAGRSDAAAFARELAEAGLVITSGMARGIDACAHEGTLNAGGQTVAVLGTGADRAYPRENTGLYDRLVAEGGLIVSEFLPGTLPLAPHFPRRNRIISGLSLGVLVVEAAPESGSLITARMAAEQGRTVWALPGSRHHPQAQGCLKLIREGATAVVNTAQILSDLPPMTGWLREQVTARDNSSSATTQTRLSVEATQVLDALGCECRHADWLIQATGQKPAQVLRLLVELELGGHVAAVAGGYERLR